jgi:hypothetical protein
MLNRKKAKQLISSDKQDIYKLKDNTLVQLINELINELMNDIINEE